LTLTEKDFDVLSAFNPQDERRGRDAMRQAQLAILANREPIQTKAIAPRRTANISNETLAASILQIAQAIQARDAKIADLSAAVAELKKGGYRHARRSDGVTETQAAAARPARQRSQALTIGRIVFVHRTAQ